MQCGHGPDVFLVWLFAVERRGDEKGSTMFPRFASGIVHYLLNKCASDGSCKVRLSNSGWPTDPRAA